ncbi:toxin glutamine deamidase domain-containing protein, partial [Formosimonas limnophila]|uniref:toxin glutamine deamidase domain-containing protein n=1 Tax=Formosimonas limnophila TaxID=1384487 RepID=UPI00227D98C5
SASYSGTDSRTGEQGGYNGFNAGLPSVMQAKDDENSTTRSGIAAGTVTIRDEAGQQAATGQTTEQTVANLNRDVTLDMQNATGLENLYERDKDKIATGFEIVKTLSENTQKFMSIMAKDIDAAGEKPAVGKDNKAITVKVFDKDGNEIGVRQLTNKEAYEKGYELGDTTVNGQTLNYATRQNLWGNGGTGSMILTGLVGAASGNVTGSGASLLQNTAINVIRQYGATQIKDIADGFMTNGKPTAESETIRGLLHSIAGCAGAAATGGDCASAAAGSAATVALNNLIAADTKNMTAEQRQAYSNLIASLVGGVTAAAGGDAAAAVLASKIEVDDNLLSRPNIQKLMAAVQNGDVAAARKLGERSAANDKELKRIYDKYISGQPLNSQEIQFIATLRTNTVGASTYTKQEVDRLVAQHPEWSDAFKVEVEVMAAQMNNPDMLRRLSELSQDLSTTVNTRPDIGTKPKAILNSNGYGMNIGNMSGAVDEETLAARDAYFTNSAAGATLVRGDSKTYNIYYGNQLGETLPFTLGVAQVDPKTGVGYVTVGFDAQGYPLLRQMNETDRAMVAGDVPFNTMVGVVNGVAGTAATTLANGGVRPSYTNGTTAVNGTVNGKPAVVGTNPAPVGNVSNVNPTGSTQNCTNCAYVVDNQLATGNTASALPRSQPLPFNELGPLYNTQMSGWVSKSHLERTLLQSGEGTRAVVYGMNSAGDTGHVWNAVVQNGRINYIDGQTGGTGLRNFSNFPHIQFGITGK